MVIGSVMTDYEFCQSIKTMKNPLVKTVENEMNQLGIGNAKLIRESYNPKSFGNADAVYDLGNIRFYFVRDRGQDLLNLSSRTSPGNSYPFCDVSLMMGWESIEQIVNVIEPVSLQKALAYIKTDWSRLDNMFSASEIMSTNTKIRQAEKKIIKAMFG